MTASNATALHCPECERSNIVGLSGGVLLCLECRHEWDPAVTSIREHVAATEAAEAEREAGFASSATSHAAYQQDADEVDAVLGPPAEVEQPTIAQAWLDNLPGQRLELDGGQIVTVFELEDDDHVRVILADGREETVHFNDVVRQLPHSSLENVTTTDVPDEAARIIVAVAGMVDATARLSMLCGVDLNILSDTIAGYAEEDFVDEAQALPYAIGDVVAAAAALALALNLPAGLVAEMAAAETDNGSASPAE